MSDGFRSNAGRWILLFQALVFFVLGGIEVWAYPKETCPYPNCDSTGPVGSPISAVMVASANGST